MLVDPIRNESHSVVLRYEINDTIATKFEIDSYKVMSIEDFKRDIIPRLQASEAESDFHYYVLRDLSNGSYLTVLPDCVIDYKVRSMADIKGEQVIQDIIAEATRDDRSNDMKLKVINMNLPVWGYAEDATRWEMAVKTPETKFQFRCPNMFHDEDEYPWVYMPPCLYTVIVNKATGGLIDSFVAFLVEDSYEPTKCRTAECCMPNVRDGRGRICRGDTHFNGISVSPDWPKMRHVTAFWDLFLNSFWNYDLLNTAKFPVNLDTVLAEFDDIPEMPGILHDTAQYLWKFLQVIKHPGAWEKFEWSRTKTI